MNDTKEIRKPDETVPATKTASPTGHEELEHHKADEHRPDDDPEKGTPPPHQRPVHPRQSPRPTPNTPPRSD